MCLYLIATNLYPGGSQANPNSTGYEWMNNYWCNLMNKITLNGQLNPGRKYAISGMVILCSSLFIFFYQFANIFVANKNLRKAMIISGLISMISATLLFSKNHDLMTTISSIFGLVVVMAIIKEIYFSKLSLYKITGVVCIFLLLINNFIYYSNYKIELLPLIQKLTFVLVLSWIVGLNFQIRKRIKTGITPHKMH